MVTLLQYPAPREQVDSTARPQAVLNSLEDLIWDEPETFFTLLAKCVSPFPVEINQHAERRLQELDLMDEYGVLYPTVFQTTQNIALRIGRTLKHDSNATQLMAI